MGLRAHARSGRTRARAARGIHRPGVAHGEPARAAAHLPIASDRGRKCRAGADRGRPVRNVLPRRALPPARAGVRRARDRTGVPAGQRADRDPLARVLGAAQPALRDHRRAAPRACAHRRRTASFRASARGRQLRDRPAAGDDPDWDRRGPVLPRAHHPRDVRRDAERVGPGVRARQHEPAGGRSDRAGRAGNAVRIPQRHAARGWSSRPRRRSRAATTSRS